MTIRHLTVGVNNYPLAPLNGCVNDARDWHQLLTERGSKGEVLLDDDATRDAILSAFMQLLLKSRWGDRVVFQFSGHGTWLPDRDGDERDHRDEALVPYDYQDAGMILDDELYAVITEYRHLGVQVLVISDSCHSGTVSRAVGLESPEGLHRIPRFLPPVMHLEPANLMAAKAVEKAPAGGVPRPIAALLAACTDEEVAWDASFEGRPNGAFTRAAIDAFRATSPKNLTQWINAIQITGQTPQLTGSWYQRKCWRAL